MNFCPRMLGAVLALLVLQSAGAAGLDRNIPRTEIEAGYGHESLTQGLDAWRNLYLEGSHKFGERHTVYGGLRETRRFGLLDNDVYGGLYYPLAATWTGIVEGNFSSTHKVLAKYSLGAQLQKSFSGGWIASAGLRHNEYTLTGSDVRTFSLERYFGDFRGAYTLFSGKPEGGGSAAAHRFQFNYYYGDVSNVGLSHTTGREVENVGAPAGLRTTDVRNTTLSGRHWFARDWAATYELLTHRQGDVYRREGLRLGLRYRF